MGTPQSISNEEIQQFLDDFETHSELTVQRKEADRERSIRQLEVLNPDAAIADQRVTAVLERAEIRYVLDRLGVDYLLIGVSRLSGRVTARFDNQPMPDVLQAVLKPARLQASISNNLVTITPLPQVSLLLAGKDDFVMRKRILRYADTRTLEPILYSLLGSDESDDDDDDDDDDSDDDYDTSYDTNDSGDDNVTSSPTKSLTFAALHAENAILIKGASADVENALNIIDAVDTDTGHIMIEATVLEFSATDLLEIGTRISDGMSGNFSDISIDWASMIGETISFTSVADAANSRAFQAAISLLLQNDEARILARPFMATVPGYQAKIDVAEDRYVTTFTENSGDVTLEPVTSGIILTMTPFLLPEEQIRMDLDVSVSQFVPTIDNVALARSRSDAISTMRVSAGQTIIIGGLMAEQTSASRAGIPGARSIPGLGFLFGERERSNAQRRVLIYITPYLWEPSMDSPTGIEQESQQFMNAQESLQTE